MVEVTRNVRPGGMASGYFASNSKTWQDPACTLKGATGEVSRANAIARNERRRLLPDTLANIRCLVRYSIACALVLMMIQSATTRKGTSIGKASVTDVVCR
jgi:hypothetical protein